MSQQELLAKVIAALKEAGIEYMISGSFVSSLQGEPRLTHDIDLVVSIDLESARQLAEAFPPPEFHLDEESIREAIRTKGMFNLIDVASGDKVDFWILTDEPFDKSRFSRKYREEVLGTVITVSTPEDTILMKLKWARMSGESEKQFLDALRVYEVQHGLLDLDYLQEWADKLGVADSLSRLMDEASPE